MITNAIKTKRLSKNPVTTSVDADTFAAIVKHANTRFDGNKSASARDILKKGAQVVSKPADK